ncbi:hypothetical protein MRX96_003372 [Rhipicephalus microplus]
MRAARTKEGGDILKSYWFHHRIWHYGVLNLEVKPWEAPTMHTRIKEVFEFLMTFRVSSRSFTLSPPSPPRGFIAIGVRVWPANMVPFLAAIDDAFEKWFLPDGFISLTHIIEDEFIGGYKECWISGGAPYRLSPHSNNTNVLGMVAIDAVDAFLNGLRLALQTETLLIHPGAWTRCSTTRLFIQGLPIEWSTEVRYLRLTINHWLSWRPAENDLRTSNSKVLGAARSFLARGHGCTHALGLRLYNAVASAGVMYTVVVASLSDCHLDALNADNRSAMREYYELPHTSQVSPTLAKAGENPISPAGDPVDAKSCTAA